MRHEKIKIWPEVTGFYPAIIPLKNINSKKRNPVLVQFSGIKEVDSCGLSILLCRLIQLYQKTCNRDWIFNDFSELDDKLESFIRKLGFIDIIRNYCPPRDLFSYDNSEPEVVVQLLNGIIKYSHPIYYLNYDSQQEARIVVEDFIDWLSAILMQSIPEGFKFKKNALLQVLKEIAKNSEDHTSGNAFFGIDLAHINSDNLIITFAFCDLGTGIYKNILDVLTANPTLFKDKNKHLGLTDVYHFAMTLNNSYPRNNTGRNRGLGMSIIHDGAQEVGLELSVFDAESRGLIDKLSNVSHEELRKYFISIGDPTGFYYYGKLSLSK